MNQRGFTTDEIGAALAPPPTPLLAARGTMAGPQPSPKRGRGRPERRRHSAGHRRRCGAAALRGRRRRLGACPRSDRGRGARERSVAGRPHAPLVGATLAARRRPVNCWRPGPTRTSVATRGPVRLDELSQRAGTGGVDALARRGSVTPNESAAADRGPTRWPANRHASMTTTPGCSLSINRRSSARVVSMVVKRISPLAWSWTQVTDLYLPRSMARMVFVSAAPDAAGFVIVFMVQTPPGGGGLCCVVTFRLPRPHGLHGFFRRRESPGSSPCR
jgi:hypothetical protein